MTWVIDGVQQRDDEAQTLTLTKEDTSLTDVLVLARSLTGGGARVKVIDKVITPSGKTTEILTWTLGTMILMLQAKVVDGPLVAVEGGGTTVKFGFSQSGANPDYWALSADLAGPLSASPTAHGAIYASFLQTLYFTACDNDGNAGSKGFDGNVDVHIRVTVLAADDLTLDS